MHIMTLNEIRVVLVDAPPHHHHHKKEKPATDCCPPPCGESLLEPTRAARRRTSPSKALTPKALSYGGSLVVTIGSAGTLWSDGRRRSARRSLPHEALNGQTWHGCNDSIRMVCTHLPDTMARVVPFRPVHSPSLESSPRPLVHALPGSTRCPPVAAARSHDGRGRAGKGASRLRRLGLP
jgi:hypothetical protein